jgi:hypothetical protein
MNVKSIAPQSGKDREYGIEAAWANLQASRHQKGKGISKLKASTISENEGERKTWQNTTSRLSGICAMTK